MGLEKIEKQVTEIMNATVAASLANLVGMAVVMEGAGTLTAENLFDRARSMAKQIGKEDEFVAEYAAVLQFARDAAAKRVSEDER